MTKTIRMTVAQAIVKFLDNQYVSMDGEETKFVEGFFTIFGHGIAVGLGASGNVLAPIVFLLLFNIPSILVKYYGTFLGYKLGSEYIQKIYASNPMNILTKAASTVGLIMVGGMTISISQQNRMKHFTIT